MSSTRALRALLVLVLATAGALVLVPSRLVASAVDACRGANQVMVAPYTCTGTAEIDGTWFTVVLDVSASGALTVTYTLDAPRPVETPLRVRSHEGRSSPDPAEATAVLAPGVTSAVLQVPMILCGQIDVKAVHTGAGDARGRIVAPWVTTVDECRPPTTTTTTATTTTTTTTTTAVPGTTAAPVTSAQVAPSVLSAPPPLPLPETGVGTAGLWAGAAVLLAGAVLVLAARRRLA